MGIEGLLHCSVVFFITWFTVPDIQTSDGLFGGQYEVSFITYAAAVLVVNAKVSLLTTSWFSSTFILYFVTTFWQYFWFYVYCGSLSVSIIQYKVAARVMKSAYFWLIQYLALVLCLVPDILVEYYKTKKYPSRVDLARELR